MFRVTTAISLFVLAVTGQPQGRTNERAEFFESKIRGVDQSCYECHSKETGQNEGGLILDTKVGLRQGGNSGPGVVANQLDESWIWSVVTPPRCELENASGVKAARPRDRRH